MAPFIDPFETTGVLIAKYWLHEGPVYETFEDSCCDAVLSIPSQLKFNPLGHIYRHIFDLNLNAIGLEKLPEDHLLVNNGQGLMLSNFALKWAELNQVKMIYRRKNQEYWIEVETVDAAIKFKLRWM